QHGRGRARLVQRDGERFHARWQLAYLHVHSRQVLALAVFRTPLAGLLVDDQLPAIRPGQGIKRVAARWDIGAAYGQVNVGLEAGCCIRAGAPDLIVRHQSAKDLPAAHGRTAVLNGDGLPVVELDRGFAWRAQWLLLLCQADCGAYRDDKHDEHSQTALTHCTLLLLADCHFLLPLYYSRWSGTIQFNAWAFWTKSVKSWTNTSS